MFFGKVSVTRQRRKLERALAFHICQQVCVAGKLCSWQLS